MVVDTVVPDKVFTVIMVMKTMMKLMMKMMMIDNNDDDDDERMIVMICDICICRTSQWWRLTTNGEGGPMRR